MEKKERVITEAELDAIEFSMNTAKEYGSPVGFVQVDVWEPTKRHLA